MRDQEAVELGLLVLPLVAQRMLLRQEMPGAILRE